LQTTYDKKMNEGKILSPTQIEDWENEIKTQGANLQGLH
jgi:hypothetical protein